MQFYIIIFFVVRIRKKNEAIYKNRIVILESLAEKLKTEVKQLNAIQEALNKKNKTMPTPPNEAWVMPPLTKTRRRVTIYVPTMPQSTLARRAHKRALVKKV